MALANCQGCLVSASSGSSSQLCKCLLHAVKNRDAPWLQQCQRDWRESYLTSIMWAASCLRCRCQAGGRVSAVSLHCRYWSRGRVSGVRKQLFVWTSSGALQQNIALMLCGLCNYCLFWKWFKVLAQLRQVNFRFWDSWRPLPAVVAAEAAEVGAFCMRNPLFWALVLFWLFQTSLPAFLMVTVPQVH